MRSNPKSRRRPREPNHEEDEEDVASLHSKTTRSRRTNLTVIRLSIFCLLWVFHSSIAFWLRGTHLASVGNNTATLSHNKVPESVKRDYNIHQLPHSKTSNQTQTNNQVPTVAMFYHAYIPPQEPRRALSIVREQLGQVASSPVARQSNFTLYTTTIGAENAYTSTVQPLCETQHLACHSLERSEEGFEDVTLTAVYDYCLHSDHIDHIVMYLHSKGSFNTNSGRNHHWRRHLTRAVTSNACLDSLRQSTSNNKDDTTICNVCGLLFQPFWTFFFPGNMWTTTCRHVNQLLPPVDFVAQLNTMLDELNLEHTNQTANTFSSKPRHPFDTSLLALNKPHYKLADYLGRGRFGMEHWIGSHPTIRPCDVSPTADILEWQIIQGALTLHNTNTTLEAPHFQLDAPWLRLNRTIVKDVLARPWQVSSDPLVVHRIDENPNSRHFFLLEGYLYKWMYFYKTFPHEDSWIWKWFPHGDHWKDAVYSRTKESRTR